METSCDLLVTGPLWAGPCSYWPKGRLEVTNGLVVYAGPDEKTNTRPKKTLDVNDGLIMPGLINAHCHSPMILFRGLSDDLPLEKWLFEAIFPAEAKWVNEEMTYWASLLAASEMLLSGTTTVSDAYFCLKGTARAFSKAKIRAVCAHGVIDFPAPGIKDPKEKFKVVEDFLQYCEDLDPLITPALFAHSTYTCSSKTLEQVAQTASDYSVNWFTHLAETQAEISQVKEQTGFTPVNHLENLGLLESLCSGAHGVWLSPEELELLAKRKVGLIHCPESNMKLASGAAKVPDWLKAGVVAGLGTDGAASNNDLDLIGELGTAAKLAKITYNDPSKLSAKSALNMALKGSSKALGLKDQLGSLLPGGKADFFVLDLTDIHAVPFYEPASYLAYQAKSSDVRDVVVNGELVVKDRKILSFDLDEAIAKVIELANKIKIS